MAHVMWQFVVAVTHGTCDVAVCGVTVCGVAVCGGSDTWHMWSDNSLLTEIVHPLLIILLAN